MKNIDSSTIMLFNKERHILNSLFRLYDSYTSTDTFLEELPLDFISFVRFFLFEELRNKLSKKNNPEIVSYHVL